MNAGVSSEKEKVKESQSHSVTPPLDTPSGAGLGRHNSLRGSAIFTNFHNLTFSPSSTKVYTWLIHMESISDFMASRYF